MIDITDIDGNSISKTIGAFASRNIYCDDGKVHQIKEILGYRSQQVSKSTKHISVCEFQLKKQDARKNKNSMYIEFRCHILLGGIALLNHACSKCSNCTPNDPNGDEEELRSNGFLKIFCKGFPRTIKAGDQLCISYTGDDEIF